MAFDPFTPAKAQIEDALAVSQRIQAMQAPPPGPQSPAQPHAAPSTYQIPAGAPNPGARFGAPPMGPPDQQQPMASRFGGGQVGVQVPQGGVNINLGPSGAVQGAGVNANVGKFDISAALNNALQLQNLQARYNPGGPFSASANYAPDQGVGGGVQYQNGPLSVGGGYDPRRGAYADLGVRTPFQEGGLATSLPGGYETRQSDLQFMNDRYNQMHEVAGKYHSARGGPAVRPV